MSRPSKAVKADVNFLLSYRLSPFPSFDLLLCSCPSLIFERKTFVDVEGTKDVKRLITLLAITGQFIARNRRGSGTRIRPFRKQMLINKHKVNRCKYVNGVFRMFSR